MPSVEQVPSHRETPPPIPESAKRKPKEETEKTEIALDALIAARVAELEAESNTEELEELGEQDIWQTARSLELSAEEIEAAKNTVGFETKRGTLFETLKKAAGNGIEKLKSLLPKKENGSEKKLETELGKELGREAGVLLKESRDLDLTQTKILKEQLKKLQNLKKLGKISPEAYEERRTELAENKKFQHLVRMEQAIRDTEAFVLGNPDAPQEEIMNQVVKQSAHKTKLENVQKNAVERAVKEYGKARGEMVEYAQDIAKKIGIEQLPKNVLDIFKHSQEAVAQLLSDTEFAEHLKPEDVIVHTDFPVAIGIEIKDVKKMVKLLSKDYGEFFEKLDVDAEHMAGSLLDQRFSTKKQGEEARRVRPLDDAVYILNGALDDNKIKETKTHELQHHIFAKFIKLQKDVVGELTGEKESSALEVKAMDELTAYLKDGTYMYRMAEIFRTETIEALPDSMAVLQDFKKIKNQMRRLETSGINPKDIYTLMETSSSLAEAVKRMELIPTTGVDQKMVLKRLEADNAEGRYSEAADWLLEIAQKEKISFNDKVIKKLDEMLFRSIKNKINPNEDELKKIKETAKIFQKITTKQPELLTLFLNPKKRKGFIKIQEN